MTVWTDVALMTGLFAIGNIYFGHFEEHTAKWCRVLKLVLFTALTAWIASGIGPVWGAAFVIASGMIGVTGHIVITRHYGIDPWTAEPRDKYYAFRGWKR